MQKKKEDYELKFIKLKEKCNKFRHDIDQIKLIYKNYKEYIKDINQRINGFNELENISVINNNGNNSSINSNTIKLDQIYSQIDVVSLCMVNLDEIILNIKNSFGDNIEYLLNDIYNNIMKIDKNEYENENSLVILLNK